MPPKKTIQKIPKNETLGILSEEKNELISDEEIQAPVPPPATPKPKRVLNQKQLETLARGRDLAHARRAKKDLDEAKQQLIEKVKRETEDKLIKTAIAVKKRQLLMERELESFHKSQEEEIPNEVVKKIIREKKQKQPPIPTMYRNEYYQEPYNPLSQFNFL